MFLLSWGMLVHGIFIFRRDILYKKTSFIIVLAFSLLLFCLSYAFQALPLGNPKLVVLLKVPLLSLAIFFVMRRIFYRMYKKNPEDTFWFMDVSLMKDGIFNFLFWFLGMFIPILMVYFIL